MFLNKSEPCVYLFTSLFLGLGWFEVIQISEKCLSLPKTYYCLIQHDKLLKLAMLKTKTVFIFLTLVIVIYSVKSWKGVRSMGQVTWLPCRIAPPPHLHSYHCLTCCSSRGVDAFKMSLQYLDLNTWKMITHLWVFHFILNLGKYGNLKHRCCC